MKLDPGSRAIIAEHTQTAIIAELRQNPVQTAMQVTRQINLLWRWELRYHHVLHHIKVLVGRGILQPYSSHRKRNVRYVYVPKEGRQ